MSRKKLKKAVKRFLLLEFGEFRLRLTTISSWKRVARKVLASGLC
jgi:hypothetical protein